jgi:hypothetical protein
MFPHGQVPVKPLAKDPQQLQQQMATLANFSLSGPPPDFNAMAANALASSRMGNQMFPEFAAGLLNSANNANLFAGQGADGKGPLIDPNTSAPLTQLPDFLAPFTGGSSGADSSGQMNSNLFGGKLPGGPASQSSSMGNPDMKDQEMLSQVLNNLDSQSKFRATADFG